MHTNIRYILLTALRDWLFGALMIGILACSMIAHMLGSTALVETQEMTLAYTTASCRIVIVTGLIIFACFHVRNAFDTREIDMFLSRPITRANLVFSYWLGFAAVSLLLVLPTVGFVAMQGLMDKKGFILWALSLLAECWLAVAVSLFASFTLRSAVTSVLASMGFYVLGRMMGFFIITSKSTFMFSQQWINLLLTYTIKSISVIVPRLDFFAKSEWLIYGVKNTQDYELGLMQAAVYIPLLVFATIIDFRRRQF